MSEVCFYVVSSFPSKSGGFGWIAFRKKIILLFLFSPNKREKNIFFSFYSFFPLLFSLKQGVNSLHWAL